MQLFRYYNIFFFSFFFVFMSYLFSYSRGACKIQIICIYFLFFFPFSNNHPEQGVSGLQGQGPTTARTYNSY